MIELKMNLTSSVQFFFHVDEDDKSNLQQVHVPFFITPFDKMEFIEFV